MAISKIKGINDIGELRKKLLLSKLELHCSTITKYHVTAVKNAISGHFHSTMVVGDAESYSLKLQELTRSRLLSQNQSDNQSSAN